jgi:glycine betaine transporter
MFEYFPLSGMLAIIALFLVFTFLVTSADSATFVLGMMTSRGALNPRTWKKLVWGLLVAMLTAATLLAEGGIHVMRAIAITGAIPFSLVMILHVLCLLKHLANEATSPPRDAP